MIRISIPKNIDIIVASYGGVGTTFLVEFLSKFKNINRADDSDGIKHSILPPISRDKKMKFLYIYGDPQLAAISLFRRNFHHVHSTKILGFANKRIRPIPRNMTLDDYANNGVDKFLFREHFYNWYSKYLVHPTFFIKYDKLHENIEALFEFLEIPKEYINDFPKFKKRSSSINDVSPETQNKIYNMYGDFNNEIKSLSDYEIRVPIKNKNKFNTYLKPVYLYALIIEYIAGRPFFYIKKKLPFIYRFLTKMEKRINDRQ